MQNRLIVLFLALFVHTLSLGAQVDRNSIIEAKEEFKWGVFAFNQGNYSDAILSFEKSISLDPENEDTHFWLGLSYYVLGFETEALLEWRNLLAQGYNTNLLNYWISAIDVRRSLLRPFYEGSNWEVLQEISAHSGFFKTFSRPTVLRPDAHGGFYLVSFGSGGVYRFDANGNETFRITGGIEPLRRPFDVLPVGDKLFVSEYGRDRISVFNAATGAISHRFGAAGIGEGFLLAPQYLAADSKGYLYVCEWGNSRISKFNQAGNFILSFGRPKANYIGLSDPTGLVVRDDKVYVADRKKKGLDVFDESGNYLMFYPINLDNLEGLSTDKDGRLLITTNQKLYAFDPYLERLTVLQDLSKSLSKSLFFGFDANSQLLVADFDKSKVTKMAPIPFIYEGLFVRVVRVLSDQHPLVRAEVVVEDRYGNPVVGLETQNFIVREGDYLIGESELEYAGYNAPDAGVAFIFDKGANNRRHLGAMKSVMRNLITALNTEHAVMTFFSAVAMPVLEREGAVTDVQGANLLDNSGWVESPKLDLTVYQAGSVLTKGPFNRAIVFLSDGQTGENFFKEHSLSEVLQFLKNNSISFYVIHFGSQPLSEEIRYLVNQTGGTSIPYTGAEGVLTLIDKIYARKSGLYLVKYESPNDPEFGYRYIPLSIEATFNKRTGMASLGYFAPVSSIHTRD